MTERVEFRDPEKPFYVTVGYELMDPSPREVFYATGMKEGSDTRHVAHDACILVSLLLQNGVSPAEIAKSLSTEPVEGLPGADLGTRPASLIGAIVDAVANTKLPPAPLKTTDPT
jgi:hypothetical protein